MKPSARLRGMGAGSLLLTLFGAVWMLLALNALSAVWLFACDFIPASLLVLRSLALMHKARQVSEWEPAGDPGAEAMLERSYSRRFLLVLALEVGAIAVAANLLSSTGQGAAIVAAIAGIVAVGFFGLGYAVAYGGYFVTGAVQLLLVAAITLVMRGRLERADPLFGLAIGLTLWLTVVMTLTQAARWTSKLRAAHQPGGR